MSRNLPCDAHRGAAMESGCVECIAADSALVKSLSTQNAALVAAMERIASKEVELRPHEDLLARAAHYIEEVTKIARAALAGGGKVKVPGATRGPAHDHDLLCSKCGSAVCCQSEPTGTNPDPVHQPWADTDPAEGAIPPDLYHLARLTGTSPEELDDRARKAAKDPATLAALEEAHREWEAAVEFVLGGAKPTNPDRGGEGCVMCKRPLPHSPAEYSVTWEAWHHANCRGIPRLSCAGDNPTLWAEWKGRTCREVYEQEHPGGGRGA